MRFFVETGRFILTALAVAMAIPTGLLLLALIDGSRFSREAFLGLAAITFVFAALGGLFVGMPALWCAKRRKWENRYLPMLLLGLMTGVLAGVLLAIPFYGFDLSFALLGMPGFGALGALAGLVSAEVWVSLHLADPDVERQ